MMMNESDGDGGGDAADVVDDYDYDNAYDNCESDDAAAAADDDFDDDKDDDDDCDYNDDDDNNDVDDDVVNIAKSTKYI